MPKLDDIIESFEQAENGEKERIATEKEKIAAKIKEQERQKQIKIEKEKQERLLANAVVKALEADDVNAVKDCLDHGFALDKMARGENCSNWYMVRLTQSPKMAELILNNLDLSDKDLREVASEMICFAIDREGSDADALIKLAKKHNLSLDEAMKNVREVHTLEALVGAGVDIQKFDYENLYENYDRAKNGYRYGREGENWKDPQPEKIPECREKLMPLVAKAAELGFELLEKDEKGENVRSYDKAFVRELINERSEGTFEASVFDKPIKMMEDELKKEREMLEAKRDAERKARADKEAQERAEKEARDKQKKIDSDYRNALRSNDVLRADEACRQGANISEVHQYVFSSETVIKPETARFVLSHIDLNEPQDRRFAERMFSIAINQKGAPIAELAEVAQQAKVSLIPAMEDAAGYSDTAGEVFKGLSKAGVDKQAFIFYELANRYYDFKYGDEHINRDFARAAQIKADLIDILQEGLKIDYTKGGVGYKFMKELACEHLYDSFSEADKKLIWNMRAGEIDEVKKSLVNGLLPENVYEYMEYVPSTKGEFFDHYKRVVETFEISHGKKPKTLEQAEIDFAKGANFGQCVEMSKMKAAGVTEVIGEKFIESLHNRYTSGEIKDLYNQLNDECKQSVADAMVTRFETLQKEKDYRAVDYFAKDMVNLYKIMEDGKARDTVKKGLLDYRTTGSNEQRRDKARVFSRIIGESEKDKFLCSLANVSLTPMSRLNREVRASKRVR